MYDGTSRRFRARLREVEAELRRSETRIAVVEDENDDLAEKLTDVTSERDQLMAEKTATASVINGLRTENRRLRALVGAIALAIAIYLIANHGLDPILSVAAEAIMARHHATASDRQR